jgi:hypothetical protein
MRKVYIVCEPTRMDNGVPVSLVDLTPAAQWGEPVILLPSTQTLLDPAKTIEVLRERLSTFDDSDFLVPIGDPVLMCMVAAIAAYANEGRVRFLKWERKLAAYIPIQAIL